MQQYLVPTPEGEQPELQLAYLVVDGQFIPANQVRNAPTLTIVTVEEGNQTNQDEEGANS